MLQITVFKGVKLVCIFLLFGGKITVILIVLFVITVFFKCLQQSHYFCNEKIFVKIKHKL